MKDFVPTIMLAASFAAAASSASAQSTMRAGPACTDFPFTNPATGRTGTVCLPVNKATLRTASPSVFCEGSRCVITAAAAKPKPGALGKIALGSGGGSKSGDDVCIIYKYHNPMKGGTGELCYAGNLKAGDVVCGVNIPGTMGESCVAIAD